MKGHCLTKPPVSTVQYKFRGTLNKHIIPKYNVATCHAHSKVLSSKSSNGAIKKSSSDFFRLIALVTSHLQVMNILSFTEYDSPGKIPPIVTLGLQCLPGRRRSDRFLHDNTHESHGSPSYDNNNII